MVTHHQSLTRRTFLENTAAGLGLMALSSLLPKSARGQEPVRIPQWRGVVNPPHLPPRAFDAPGAVLVATCMSTLLLSLILSQRPGVPGWDGRSPRSTRPASS